MPISIFNFFFYDRSICLTCAIVFSISQVHLKMSGEYVFQNEF